MSDVTKIRCPHCSGKIAIDHDYFAELSGQVISCPHCAEQMSVPESSAQPSVSASGAHGLDRTQEIQMPPLSAPARPTPRPSVRRNESSGARLCPHCGVEVGERDRVCITCGEKIPLPEPPAGFSQIRA